MSKSLAQARIPSSGEGGGEKVLAGFVLTDCQQTTCGEIAADFCTARPSEEDSSLELKGLVESLKEGKFLLRGRPPKLTPGLKKSVCMLLCLGISRRQAATIADIDHATISHAAERDADFGRALLQAEEFSRVGPKITLAAAGLRDWRAAAWLLKHQEERLPISMTSEERAERHQAYLEVSRQCAESEMVNDVLREEREAAREARQAARKEQAKARKQAQFEADNPQLFRHRKKKKVQVVENPGESP
jgi:hypothetical protein